MARNTAARAGCPGKRASSRTSNAPRARQMLRKSPARAIDQLQQFAAAERSGQIDFLPREEVTQIERAGIEEIARRPRLHKGLHAIARTQALEFIGCVCFAVQIHAQAAADRRYCSGSTGRHR